MPIVGIKQNTKHQLYSGVNAALLGKAELQILKELTGKFHQKKLNDKSALVDVVGEMTGFGLVKVSGNFGGYCDLIGKTIALHPCGDWLEKGGIWLDAKTVDRKTICHEIAHFAQMKVGTFDEFKTLLSENVRTEQQAETMAAVLYQNWFGVCGRSLPLACFDAYFKKSDIEFLADWYGDWVENDLILT